MTSDDLAEQVADHFNDLDAPLIEFQAVVPEDVEEYQLERHNFQVYVIPTGESETPIDRGDACDERRIVSVIISGPIGQVTKRIAMRFGEQLRRSLYETEFSGYRWIGNETTTLVAYDFLKSKNQFVSRFDAEFFGIA